VGSGRHGDSALPVVVGGGGRVPALGDPMPARPKPTPARWQERGSRVRRRRRSPHCSMALVPASRTSIAASCSARRSAGCTGMVSKGVDETRTTARRTLQRAHRGQAQGRVAAVGGHGQVPAGGGRPPTQRPGPAPSGLRFGNPRPADPMVNPRRSARHPRAAVIALFPRSTLPGGGSSAGTRARGGGTKPPGPRTRRGGGPPGRVQPPAVDGKRAFWPRPGAEQSHLVGEALLEAVGWRAHRLWSMP